MDPPLEVTVKMMGTEIVVEVVGVIDLTTVKALAEPLVAGVAAVVTEPTVEALTVDLRQVDFIDSAGLALLVDARKRLAPQSKKLQVFVTVGKQPLRVLRTGRFDTIMTLKHDFDNDVDR